MFASFAVSLDDASDLTGSGLSLSMRLRCTEGNQLRLELESSAALSSCECRINEPEMRRLTHSMLPDVPKPSIDSVANQRTTNSVYPSPRPLQLYVSRPSVPSELPENTFISPSTMAPQPSCEPELSSVSKLAAVSSTNELSKCFQSVSNSRISLLDARTQPKQQTAPLLSSHSSDVSDAHTNSTDNKTDSDNDNSSDGTSSSGLQPRSRSASLPLNNCQLDLQSQQDASSVKQENSGSDTSDSDDSKNNDVSSSVSALLQRAAIQRPGLKNFDIKQGIDVTKQRERLRQISNLPLEALTSADLMNAAVSLAKKNT